MGLFSKSQIDSINAVAKKSKTVKAPKTNKKISSINDELIRSSEAVREYFKDSKAILITTKDELHDYVTKAIESGYAGIDTETTGLDRNKDYIVGASLYYPGGVECYIAMKHRIPVFEDLYKNQLTYEEVAAELNRFVESKTKLIFANANYDLYMIWKDLHVDLDSCFYYDVILAWRCLKEDELHNDLKHLYMKYVQGGKGDPKRFSDFFTPQLFPYSKPDVAKLYAANDAKITYDLFVWQYQYTNPNSKKCKKHKLENIAALIWDVEFPLVHICQTIERTGIYVDQDMGKTLQNKYHALYDKEMSELRQMVQDVIDKNPVSLSSKKPPFTSGENFNPKSTLHVQYLLYTLLGVEKVNGKMPTGKEHLDELDMPIASKISKVRSLATNINTFVDKLPNAVAKDGKIHADFKQIGAACVTGDTKIDTDHGLVEIEDIYRQANDNKDADSDSDGKYIELKNIDFKVKNYLGNYEKPEAVVFYKNQPTVKVLMCSQHGTKHKICGTYNHPVLTTHEEQKGDELFYTPLCELKLGNIVGCYDSNTNSIDWCSVFLIDISQNDVYDLVMPKTHSFVGNGVVNHNTGRMSSSNPNLQNIPSKLNDIRHLFRGDPKSKEIVKESKSDKNSVEFAVCQDRLVKVVGEDKEKHASELSAGDILTLNDDSGNNVEAAISQVEPIENKQVRIVCQLEG